MTRTEINKDKKLFDLVVKQNKLIKEYTKSKQFKLIKKTQEQLDEMNKEIKTHTDAIEALRNKANVLTTTKDIQSAMEVDGKYMNQVQDVKEQILKELKQVPVSEFEEITIYKLLPKSVELTIVDAVEEFKKNYTERKANKK